MNSPAHALDRAPAAAMDEFGIEAIRQAAARLQGRVVRTPLLESPMLSERAGCRLFVKAESLQLTGSFKIRGALNKILSMDEPARRAGIVAFSAGNHGEGVAAAARAVGCPAVIVMPNTAPRIKVDNCRWWGAEVVAYDPQTEDRVEVAQRAARSRGMAVVPPFDDHAVMAGQGTCGLEIAEQLNALQVVPDAVVINCSGGGLASGVAEASGTPSPPPASSSPRCRATKRSPARWPPAFLKATRRFRRPCWTASPARRREPRLSRYCAATRRSGWA